MKEQNNNPEFLRILWSNCIITSNEYFFRLKAQELGIKTFAEKTKKLKEFINQLN